MILDIKDIYQRVFQNVNLFLITFIYLCKRWKGKTKHVRSAAHLAIGSHL